MTATDKITKRSVISRNSVDETSIASTLRNLHLFILAHSNLA
jgi:hypothetical protein